MRHIRVIYPGKTREGFIREGMEKYMRFLRPYARIELVELKEAKGSPEDIIERESRAILASVRGRFILLDREGKAISSEEFAGLLKDMAQVEFVIGGAYGVSEELKKEALFRLSLSRLTFTHELSRLLLLEQLYRAMTIIHGKRYHY